MRYVSCLGAGGVWYDTQQVERLKRQWMEGALCEASDRGAQSNPWNSRGQGANASVRARVSGLGGLQSAVQM